jgi:hypothetical protein
MLRANFGRQVPSMPTQYGEFVISSMSQAPTIISIHLPAEVNSAEIQRRRIWGYPGAGRRRGDAKKRSPNPKAYFLSGWLRDKLEGKKE